LLFSLAGAAVYFGGVMFSVFRITFRLGLQAQIFNALLIWYSGMPVTFGIGLCAADLLLMFPKKRRIRRWVEGREGEDARSFRVTVVLTAYNDEESIAAAVLDFKRHPAVDRVIVVSNNSADRTMSRALDAGALVVNEMAPGYGRCVYRCYTEALKFEDADVIVLCEGDCTFRARDLDKFLAYLPHAELVNGSRIVEQLRALNTQLSTFMYYGNFFVGKLLEMKHLGRGTFTDVGTTYKCIRREALERLLPRLNPAINLEFNAHFLDVALENNVLTVECPITFHARVGESKGGNVDNRRATKVGLTMIRGITLGWKHSRRN
jgi:glycosyltransferase involved in cell wall biosynthesis